MTNPPEPSRIVQFRQRRPRPRGSAPHSVRHEKPATIGPTNERDVVADLLLEISSIEDPWSGEQEGVHHLRAVRLGASSGAFYPHTPTEQTPLVAARLGISAVEIMLQTLGEYDPAFIRQVAENAAAAGVQIPSVHSLTRLHPFFDPYPRRVEEAHALFRRAIDACVKLGAKVLVWHGPNRTQAGTDEGWERFISVSHVLAETCGAAGITLGIENVSYGPLARVRDIANFVRRLKDIGSQRQVGFVFDPFQAAEAGANPFLMLAAMGNRVVNVHISDYREHDRAARHLLPGDGNLPWSALLRSIAGSGYGGAIMIEGPLGTDRTGIARVRQTLDPLIRSVFPFDPDAYRYDEVDDHAVTMIGPPAGVLKGIALFNERAFYEQHEEIEAEWHAERGPIRRLYQGLLQIGIGFHHALNDNYQGAVALLTDGIAKTADFQPYALGIDTGKLVSEAKACLDRIVALGPERIADFDHATIPTITFTKV